jgi:hypothetical protein
MEIARGRKAFEHEQSSMSGVAVTIMGTHCEELMGDVQVIQRFYGPEEGMMN